MLSLVDLAGSERPKKTLNEGERLKESANINTTLLTLGRCIQALKYNQTHPANKHQIVPFRESRLTRLFQTFFQGKGRAMMIVNVNQLASTFDETLHAIKFSAIAKEVVIVTQPDPPPKPVQINEKPREYWSMTIITR
jgi:kinesin family protein 20